MKKLNETTNVNILSQFDLGTGYQAVVQKGNVGSYQFKESFVCTICQSSAKGKYWTYLHLRFANV